MSKILYICSQNNNNNNKTVVDIKAILLEEAIEV